MGGKDYTFEPPRFIVTSGDAEGGGSRVVIRVRKNQLRSKSPIRRDHHSLESLQKHGHSKLMQMKSGVEFEIPPPPPYSSNAPVSLTAIQTRPKIKLKNDRKLNLSKTFKRRMKQILSPILNWSKNSKCQKYRENISRGHVEKSSVQEKIKMYEGSSKPNNASSDNTRKFIMDPERQNETDITVSGKRAYYSRPPPPPRKKNSISKKKDERAQDVTGTIPSYLRTHEMKVKQENVPFLDTSHQKNTEQFQNSVGEKAPSRMIEKNGKSSVASTINKYETSSSNLNRCSAKSVDETHYKVNEIWAKLEATESAMKTSNLGESLERNPNISTHDQKQNKKKSVREQGKVLNNVRFPSNQRLNEDKESIPLQKNNAFIQNSSKYKSYITETLSKPEQFVKNQFQDGQRKIDISDMHDSLKRKGEPKNQSVVIPSSDMYTRSSSSMSLNTIKNQKSDMNKAKSASLKVSSQSKSIPKSSLSKSVLSDITTYKFDLKVSKPDVETKKNPKNHKSSAKKRRGSSFTKKLRNGAKQLTPGMTQSYKRSSKDSFLDAIKAGGVRLKTAGKEKAAGEKFTKPGNTSNMNAESKCLMC